MATAATSLTDDLVVEILSRLPFRSVCRCKCVSRAWRDLISHPDHRRKLPKTLPGFFHNNHHDMAIHVAHDLPLTHIPGTAHPSISFDFLPHTHVRIMDYCNGLLLCRGWCDPAVGPKSSEYVVCNPATKEWIALPQSTLQDELMEAYLCFDPAVSPHFHVVEHWLENDLHYASYVTGISVYSSQTRAWVPKENGWDPYFTWDDPLTRPVNNPPTTVFLHGCLHWLTYRPDVAVVDMEGKTWRNIPIPGCYEVDNDTHYGFIQQSQGRLHYAAYEKENGVVVRLVIYVLEDYDSQDWILKHSVEDPNVVTGFDWWVAIHPECNLVFYTASNGRDKTLMSYDMDHRRVQVMCKLERDNRWKYVPYEPLYMDLQALQM